MPFPESEVRQPNKRYKKRKTKLKKCKIVSERKNEKM
jgi:hypothetical protein